MRLDDNETRISRGARRCRQAWVHGSPHVEDLALPKSLKSGNFTLAKADIRWMSDEGRACLVLAGFATLGPLSVAAQAQGFKPQPISGTISFGPPTPARPNLLYR